MSAEPAEQPADGASSRTRPRRSTSVTAPAAAPPPPANGSTPPAKAAKSKQPAASPPPIPTPPASSSPTRRMLSPYQRSALEAAFSVCEFISKKTARAIGDKIGIDEPRVIIWFRNKRVQIRKNGPGGAARGAATEAEANDEDNDQEQEDAANDNDEEAEQDEVEREPQQPQETESAKTERSPLPTEPADSTETAPTKRARKPKQEYVPKRRKNAAERPHIEPRSTRRSRSNADEELPAASEADTSAAAEPTQPVVDAAAAPVTAGTPTTDADNVEAEPSPATEVKPEDDQR